MKWALCTRQAAKSYSDGLALPTRLWGPQACGRGLPGNDRPDRDAGDLIKGLFISQLGRRRARRGVADAQPRHRARTVVALPAPVRPLSVQARTRRDVSFAQLRYRLDAPPTGVGKHGTTPRA